MWVPLDDYDTLDRGAGEFGKTHRSGAFSLSLHLEIEIISAKELCHDYLVNVQHAAVVVAPLRVARGIQNKILEAMAMARPVVVSSATGGGLSGVPGRDFEVAETAADFAARVLALLDPAAGARMGQSARTRIVADYSWERNLATFDHLLDGSLPVAARAGQ